MTDRLNEIWRRWTWNLLCQIPMIANGHVISSMKALDVADDLRNDTAQAVPDRNDPCTIKLRRLHMQQIVEASIGHFPSEDIQSSQIGGFFNAQPALN